MDHDRRIKKEEGLGVVRLIYVVTLIMGFVKEGSTPPCHKAQEGTPSSEPRSGKIC